MIWINLISKDEALRAGSDNGPFLASSLTLKIEPRGALLQMSVRDVLMKFPEPSVYPRGSRFLPTLN